MLWSLRRHRRRDGLTEADFVWLFFAELDAHLLDYRPSRSPRRNVDPARRTRRKSLDLSGA
jgi:hypothetical protein